MDISVIITGVGWEKETGEGEKAAEVLMAKCEPVTFWSHKQSNEKYQDTTSYFLDAIFGLLDL